jgi:hypothetical protein
MIEENLKAALLKMKPEEATLFLDHWKKLDLLVRSTLTPETGGKKRKTYGKRTLRNKRR